MNQGNQPTSSRGIFRRAVSAATIALVSTTVIACGSVQLERAAGVKKFRALPVGTPVMSQDSVEGLATPVLVVGVLKIDTKTKVETPDTAAATEKLKGHAATFGCDALIGATSKSTTKLFKKKMKSLGQDGRPVYRYETTTIWTHHWRAQCVRTAKAPKDVVMRRDKYGRLRPAGSAAKSTGKSGAAGSSNAADTSSAAGSAPAKTSSKSTAATSGQSKGAATSKSAADLPTMAPQDAKLASEVARAFMTFSRYAASANSTMLCKMLDSERIYFDIRTKEPALSFKKDMTPKAACASMKNGKLSRYLQDFGPAEVHTEIPTLIPSLFRIHGGAYLKLDEARDRLYRQKLVASRKGKTPLQCEMYSVLPAGNLFKVMLDCSGVRSYRLLLRRDGPNDFKLMALTHLR